MSDNGWKGIQARNIDGRSGVIHGHVGFMHTALTIYSEGEAIGRVQLNADGPDTGDTGWQWLCTNWCRDGKAWLPLGDHSGCEVDEVVE